MRTCSACHESKSLSEFYHRKSGGTYTKCKPCYNENKKMRDAARQHVSITTKICRVCKESQPVSEYHVNRSQTGGVGSICKSCTYLTGLETNYGIKNIDVLISQRSGKCDVCGDSFVRKPHVDHDHSCCPVTPTCGKCFRGLLCSECNHGLGKFKDDPRRLSSAIQYLRRFNDR